MKAQAAMEFIVILSITLILIVVGIFIFADTASNRTKIISDSQAINLAAGDIGILAQSINAKGTYLRLINNGLLPVQIQKIDIGTTTLESHYLPLTLAPGEDRIIYGYNLIGEEGQPYDYDITINYTSKGQNHVRLDNGRPPKINGQVRSLDNYQILRGEDIARGLIFLAQFNNDTLLQENNTNFVESLNNTPAPCTGTTCPTTNSTMGFSSALQLDGNDDYLTFITTLGNMSNATISLWLYNTDFDADGTALVFDTGYASFSKGVALEIRASGRIYTYGSGGDFEIESPYPSSIILSENTWYHLVYDRTATIEKIYLNGILEVNRTSFMNPFPFSQNITIGSNYLGTTSNFKGYIDEVAIWNRTLTQAEINSLYNRGRVHLQLD